MTPLLTLLLLWAYASAPAARGQEKDFLTPQESEAKAKEILQRGVQALGGERYLKARDVYCEGRLANYDSQGLLAGYTEVFDYVLFPDKNRTEYYKKRNIIYVNNGAQGWSLDRAGVEESPAERGTDYLDSLKTDIHNLLRFRLNEEGMNFRYQGKDMVDLKPSEWVEITDRERRVLRIAFVQATGLPIRATFVTRNRETRVRTEEVEYYSNYHTVEGIETALRVYRERNGRMVHQLFWNKCAYNTGVQESFFTREALEQAWAKLKK
jgi:hypothetical protein